MKMVFYLELLYMLGVPGCAGISSFVEVPINDIH
jgi:hypothetical protein